ncbi:uncharacterized protein LOC123205242 [Mangifera indica]|uniref:uncharacterized protein LOC123205242 n=1 Tax=Mangifera indica TaxID=29780 RepID=UPI001CFA9BDD|nr:uncharacterized protein LOC123205242 [Mangifera indica]
MPGVNPLGFVSTSLNFVVSRLSTMSSSVVASASSSFSTAFSRIHCIETSPNFSLAIPCLKSTFQGASLQEAEGGISDLFKAARKSGLINESRGLEITARTAVASKTTEVEVDKPLGLTLGQKSGGGVVITVSFTQFFLNLLQILMQFAAL